MSYEKSLFFIIKDKGQINFYLYSRDLYSRDLCWLEVVWLHAPAMPASPQLHSRTGLSILNITDIFVSGALFLLFKDSFAVFDLLFFSNSMPGLWSLTRNLFAIMLISHLPYMNLDEYMCVSIYMCVCTYVCVYIYMSLWVCMCVCVLHCFYSFSLVIFSTWSAVSSPPIEFIPYRIILLRQFTFSLCYILCIPLEFCIYLCYRMHYIAP